MTNYEDKELEAILRKKYEAYMKQQQALQSEQTEASQQILEAQRKELIKDQLMKMLFTPGAREILRNLELRGDTKLVEQILMWAKRMYDMGRIREKITKDQLKVILKYLRQEQKKEWKINIKRK